MPPLLLLGALALGGWWYVKRAAVQTVIGYVDGLPVSLQVRGIGNGASLRVDCAAAWDAMVSAASDVGLDLHCSGPRAGFRTSEEQAALRGEVGAYGEGGYAAAPGKSPHQSGTAVDIANQNPAAGDFDEALSLWLRGNGPTFGFNPAGDSFSTKEPWHFQWTPGVWSPPGVA